LLEKRTQLIKQEFEKKLKQIVKQQLDKEIEYKSKIDSLGQDLKRYYEGLKKSKEKYYLREKELKEKLKEILN
jgi:flagellar biosynthesis regulator FlbT